MHWRRFFHNQGMRVFLLFVAVMLHAESLRVVSYNVRYPAKGDGANVWEARKDLFVASVKAMDPDVMGTQELFKLQGDYLVERAPEYKWFGVSRRGNSEDEHMGVFYKPAKLRVVESGNYWLSETPETVGSSSWDMSLPRMVTWAVFESKATKKRFFFANTHFPHRGQQDAKARLECAKVIAARLAKVKAGLPVILTGDFNAGADTDVHQLLTQTLEDAWEKAPQRFGPEQTFHGFTGKTDGRRIDWILTRGWKALVAQTGDLNSGGRYPSDHFPVLALLEL
jgi:endonuclease/exonuclease/phosphatase family metal-dependent hydrolase